MKLDLFEIHDQQWCPEFIRNEITLILELLWTLDLPLPFFKALYLSVLEIISEKLDKNTKIIDLCSGSGGPLVKVSQKLDMSHKVKIILTDMYPNHEAITNLSGNTNISYERESVDACKVPSRLFNDSKNVIRTVFGAFHHLREHVAKKVLKDAISNSHGIIIVDLPDRSFMSVFCQSLLFYVVGILFLVYIRPLNLSRLLFLPLVITILTIDGILSALRTYSQEDYWRILAEIPGAFDNYSWEIKHISMFSIKGYSFSDNFIGSFVESLLCRVGQLQVLQGFPRSRD